MERSLLGRRVGTAALLAAAGFGLCASAALGANGVSSPADVKSAFDASMAKPLDERVPALEALDRKIEAEVFSGKLTGAAKTEALYYKFHSQLQLAEIDRAPKTYADYLKSLKQHKGSRRAGAVLAANAGRWKRRRELTHCALACQAVAGEFADDTEIASEALYHLAWCQFRMNGTSGECVKTCERLIAEHPDSPRRPEAMRMLANCCMAMGRHNDALKTLALLKQQYPGTKWTHYADMRRAVVYERGKGDPQAALGIYTESLARYPDHLYALYVQQQMSRLRRVIEEQLIQDAMQDVAEADVCDRHTQTVVVRAESHGGKRVARTSVDAAPSAEPAG